MTTFTDVKFQTAKEKEQALKAWVRFLKSGLRWEQFTKALYREDRQKGQEGGCGIRGGRQGADQRNREDAGSLLQRGIQGDPRQQSEDQPYRD